MKYPPSSYSHSPARILSSLFIWIRVQLNEHTIVGMLHRKILGVMLFSLIFSSFVSLLTLMIFFLISNNKNRTHKAFWLIGKVALPRHVGCRIRQIGIFFLKTGLSKNRKLFKMHLIPNVLFWGARHVPVPGGDYDWPYLRNITCLSHDVLHYALHKIIVRRYLLGEEGVVLEICPYHVPRVFLSDFIRVFKLEVVFFIILAFYLHKYIY